MPVIIVKILNKTYYDETTEPTPNASADSSMPPDHAYGLQTLRIRNTDVSGIDEDLQFLPKWLQKPQETRQPRFFLPVDFSFLSSYHHPLVCQKSPWRVHKAGPPNRRDVIVGAVMI